jgi:hypothetical protein
MGKDGWSWWSIAGLGAIAGGALMFGINQFWCSSAVDSPSCPCQLCKRLSRLNSWDTRRQLLGGTTNCGFCKRTSELCSIPIPRVWKVLDPRTTEGRRGIAERLINHDHTGEAMKFLWKLANSIYNFEASDEYSFTVFEAEVELALSKTPDRALEKPLWKHLIPTVWDSVPTLASSLP